MSANILGIMQGRLSPRYKGRYQAFPANCWKEEFFMASSIGFGAIEFIFDFENYENNPLFNEKGIQEIEEVIERSKVKVYSLCADYFMKSPLFCEEKKERNKNVEVLQKVLKNCSRLGIRDITIPCVDESSLRTEKSKHKLKESLLQCLPVAEKHGVSINLETDLPPQEFLKLIEEVDHPFLKVNYDTGNSAALDYDPVEEINSYGDFISVLHIKDRILNGGSVKLGTGDTDIAGVVEMLKNRDFKGTIIMQAARADEFTDEHHFVKEQFSYLNTLLSQYQ